MRGTVHRLRQIERHTLQSPLFGKMKLLYPEKPEYFTLNPELLQGFGAELHAYDPKQLIPGR